MQKENIDLKLVNQCLVYKNLSKTHLVSKIFEEKVKPNVSISQKCLHGGYSNLNDVVSKQIV